MKREYKILIGILILALLIRVIFSFSSPVRWWDETVYANLGYDLSRGMDYSFNHGWGDFAPDGSWPRAGFRAPLLPYSLAILYLLRLDFLVDFFILIIGTLSVVFIYFLARKLFNEKIALYSALFLALVPLHVFYSGKISTDIFSTFFILITIIAFWKGYEEGNRRYKILFGFFLALSVLARYTSLWIMPVFLVYFLIRKRLAFLKDKYLWLAVLVFFITLIPWFIYGYFEYGNPIGAFLHGAKASGYWGGVQPWYEYFKYSWNMFSVLGIVFLFYLGYIIYKKQFLRKEIYLLLFWIFFTLFFAIIMPHKEDRYILSLVPAVCILSGFFIDKIGKYRNILLAVILIILIASLSFSAYNNSKNYNIKNHCFLEACKFLRNVDKDALIITDESPIVYYYTQHETHYYPNPWTISSVNNLISLKERDVYFLFSEKDMPLTEEEHLQIKKDLDNFTRVFECSNVTFVYKADAKI